MAEYAISIEKTVSFQGALEKFSNAYTFDTNVGETFDDEANINWLVGLEKAVFGTGVTFVTARSYGIGGVQAANVMRAVKDLTGTGTQSGTSIYKECAILVNFQLPRSAILRRKRTGRKWLHVGQLQSGATIPGGLTDGSTALTTALKNFYLTNYANPLVTDTPPGGGRFASNGDNFSAPTVNDWLEHRQFHAG